MSRLHLPRSGRPLHLALTLSLAAAACASHRADCKRNPTLACFEGGNAGSGGQGAGGSGGASTSTGAGTTDTPTTTGPFPPTPTLGPIVDRMGRPAISAALIHPFDGNPETQDLAKDEWNQKDDPASWTAHIAEMQTSLAILDAFDTVCGNQLLADMTQNDPSRYAALAGLLSDDRLYVNIDGPTCSTFLSVELDALGLSSNDCGGRPPEYDVIDILYTIFMTGTLDASVGDNVPISDAATRGVFPHLQEPHG